MSELTKEKIYKKELIKAGATGNNNLERIRSLAGGGGTSSKLQSTRAKAVVKAYSEFENKTWINQPTEFYGWRVWTDGDNIYFTSGFGNYILNKETSTWEEIDLGENITTDDIWTDGENIYAYVYGGAGYIFDKKKKKWLPKEFNVSFNSGGVVWTDGENIYAYNGTNEYIWNKETWELTQTNVPQNFASTLVWSDGTKTYYSNNGNNYVLDKATHTWSTKEWTGLTNINGSFVWFDGKNVHYSDGSRHYVLDIKTSNWEEISYSSEVGYFTGNNVWTDGENVYISYNENQQVMQISDGIIPH